MIAKNFARIHKANLVNAGILPLEFDNPEDYDRISLSDELRLTGVLSGLETGCVMMTNRTAGNVIPLKCDISARQAAVIRAGGLLNYTREQTK